VALMHGTSIGTLDRTWKQDGTGELHYDVLFCGMEEQKWRQQKHLAICSTVAKRTSSMGFGFNLFRKEHGEASFSSRPVR